MERIQMLRLAVFHLLLTAPVVLPEGLSQAADVEKTWPGRLRGMCLSRVSEAAASEEVFRRLAGWHVNVVTVSLGTDESLGLKDAGDAPELPSEMAEYRRAFHLLDKILALARKYGMHVVLTPGRVEGRNHLNVWEADTDAENTVNFVENLSRFWTYTANRYKNEPAMLAYDLLSEPHAKSVVRIWRSELAPRLVREVRAVDTETWLLFEPGPWGMPGGFETLEPLKDPRNGESRMAYGFHMYAPHNYTHQGIGDRPKDQAYPGMLKMFPGSPLKQWDRNALEEFMKPALDFRKKHGVRMYIGEFSVIRWAPGRARWVEDAISIFEENGLDWAFHSYTGWNGWNPTFPPDAKGNNEPDGGYEGERLKVLKKYWRRNRDAPRSPMPVQPI